MGETTTLETSTVETGAILEVANVSKAYPMRQGAFFGRGAAALQAVDDVSFSLSHGEALGIVGESGCGKSGLARAFMGRETARADDVRFRGRNVRPVAPQELREISR